MTMDTRSQNLASALLCALTLALAALLVHPVMEAEIMDDASYTRTANAYIPMPQGSAPRSCHPKWDYLMPGFKPSYAVSFTGNACGGPAGVAPVTYRAWLPPRQRKIYVIRYTDAPSADKTLTEKLKSQEDQ